MSFAYIEQYYGVKAGPGRRVVVYGKPGIIVRAMGQYIGVNFDEAKPGVVLPCHPVDGVEYGDIGVIRRQTRAQRRYQEYLEAEWFPDSFGDWLKLRRSACPQ